MAPSYVQHHVLRGLRYLSTAAVLGAAGGLLIAACSQPGDPIIGAGPPPTGVAAAGPVPAPTSTPDAPAGLRVALQAARDRWRISGPATYEHELAPSCRCDPGTLPHAYGIRANDVIDAVRIDGGEWNPRPRAISGLLREVERRTSIIVDPDPRPIRGRVCAAAWPASR